MTNEIKDQDKQTGLSEAVSTAKEFTAKIDQTEGELQLQNEELSGMVETLRRQQDEMNHKINDLEDEIQEATRDCFDRDSPEAMAGEVAPPIDPDGGPS